MGCGEMVDVGSDHEIIVPSRSAGSSRAEKLFRAHPSRAHIEPYLLVVPGLYAMGCLRW